MPIRVAGGEGSPQGQKFAPEPNPGRRPPQPPSRRTVKRSENRDRTMTRVRSDLGRVFHAPRVHRPLAGPTSYMRNDRGAIAGLSAGFLGRPPAAQPRQRSAGRRWRRVRRWSGTARGGRGWAGEGVDACGQGRAARTIARSGQSDAIDRFSPNSAGGFSGIGHIPSG